MRMVVILGTLVGALYTLSPLTVLCLAGLWPLVRWAARGLSPRELRWFATLLAAAIGLRLIVIAGLFLTADPARPFAVFFGDEELFKSRSVWFRNVALGIPISPADFIYAFDAVGSSSYLYALAYLQALVGDAPYGLHVLNASLYLAGVLALYRLVRPAYGGLAAITGLAFLLFLPSLFVWSISALKEPAYILAAAIHVICAVHFVRATSTPGRIAAVIGAAVAAIVLGSLRTGGLYLAVAGTVTGLLLAWIVKPARRLLIGLAVAPLVLVVVLSQSAVQDRLLHVARLGAVQHRGHLATPGNTYTLLDPWLYKDTRAGALELKPDEARRYTVRSIAAYFAVPLPWQLESRVTLLYLPEQLLWYIVALLVPFGVLAGLRRDVVLTSVLLMQAAALALTVALSSGNIGTLVRHRGLALPYLVWLAALGGCEVVRRLTARAAAPSDGVVLQGERAWQ